MKPQDRSLRLMSHKRLLKDKHYRDINLSPEGANTADFSDRRLREIFGKGAEVFGQRHYTIFTCDLDDPSQWRGLPVACRGWLCSYCGVNLKIAWHKHWCSVLAHQDYVGYRVLRADQIPAFKKRISRDNAESDGIYGYLRAWQDVGKTALLVVTNLPGYGTPISQADLPAFLVETIANVPWMRKPLSTSANWTRTEWAKYLEKIRAAEAGEEYYKPRKRKKPKRQVVMGLTYVSPIVLRAAADHLDGISASAGGDGGCRIDLVLSREWMGREAVASLKIHLGIPRGINTPDLLELDRQAQARRALEAV